MHRFNQNSRKLWREKMNGKPKPIRNEYRPRKYWTSQVQEPREGPVLPRLREKKTDLSVIGFHIGQSDSESED